jgi:hypothetical protein
MTVGELDQRMDSAEFSEWIAFAQIDPFPDPHLSAAKICQTIAASNGMNANLEDFLPYTVEPERLTADESAGLLGRLFAGRTDEA